METLENIARVFGLAVEDLLAASRENSKRVYFVNEFCSVLHLDIDGKLVSIKDEGVWVDIPGDTVTVKVTGDFDLSEQLELAAEEEKKLKDKLILKAAKWASDSLFDLILQADCTYKISDIKDGETIKFAVEEFSLGDKTLVYQELIVMYPRLVREIGGAELVEASGKNSRQIIKTYKKLGLQSDFGMDFILMFLFYPIRAWYFKHLCKPHILKKNILNAEKHKEIDKKRSKKKKHTVLKTICFSIIALLVLFVGLPMRAVPNEQPALLSTDYQTITLFNDEFHRIDELPFDANGVRLLGAEMWYGVRTDGLSRLEQLSQNDMVKIYEDGEGYLYLWLVFDYTDTILAESGDPRDYNDFEEHMVYKSAKPQK